MNQIINWKNVNKISKQKKKVVGFEDRMLNRTKYMILEMSLKKDKKKMIQRSFIISMAFFTKN